MPSGSAGMRAASSEHGLLDGTVLRELQGVPQGPGLRAGVRPVLPTIVRAEARHARMAWPLAEPMPGR
jgi:hypothetical protein